MQQASLQTQIQKNEGRQGDFDQKLFKHFKLKSKKLRGDKARGDKVTLTRNSSNSSYSNPKN